ncbi:MAG: pyridoxamine 5'-phosphate oxidase family protein [candidate division WOR-3 bacterium]
MKLSEYFEKSKGIGVLATADPSGRVNTSLYARPHVIDGEHVAFIMTERRTYANLKANAYASYLFKEHESGVSGLRLSLKKIHEDDDQDRIQGLMRRRYGSEELGRLHLVYFHIEEMLPLISSGKLPIEA